MDEINKLRKFYHLKNVERKGTVLKRRESSAEHSWSTLILADYFLGFMKGRLNRLKVYELLMYHDIVEIEAGDVGINDEEGRKGKKERERAAMKKLREDFPVVLKEKVWDLFEEFEAEKTKESRFAKAVDFLDAQIHELDYKKDWKGWTEEMLRRYKGPYFEEFPELKEAFEKMIEFCHAEGYFSQ